MLFLLSSCRTNSFAPTTTENILTDYEEIDPFKNPEKGDIFYQGDKIDIEYKIFSMSDKVDVFVEKKGAVRYVLGEGVKNDGKLIWQTTSQTRPSVQYKIRIVNSNDPEIFILSGQFGLLAK